MRFLLIIIHILLLFKYGNPTFEHCPNVKTSIGAIRKRRHLSFPDGSNLGITISLAKAFHTHVPSGWFMVMDMDLGYPLPDSKFTSALYRRKLHHRQKREFWEKIHTAFELYNLNGRACVLRSICEAKSFLAPPGKSLVHDLLRAIFTAPVHDEDFANEVSDKYDELLDPNVCEEVHDCSLSLVHFILNLNKQKY